MQTAAVLLSDSSDSLGSSLAAAGMHCFVRHGVASEGSETGVILKHHMFSSSPDHM